MPNINDKRISTDPDTTQSGLPEWKNPYWPLARRQGAEIEFWKGLAKRLLKEHHEMHGYCSSWPNAPQEDWLQRDLEEAPNV